MPVEMGQLGSIIKASPAPCSLIHFSHLLLLGKQVSAKPLLLLFLLKQSLKLSGTLSCYWTCSMPAYTYHERGKWRECLPREEGGPVRCLVGRGLGSTYVPLPVAFTGLCQDETKNPLHIPELSSALCTACALIPS